MDEQDDPVLQMRGVGKEIWSDTNADEYVRSLRSDWFDDEAEVTESEKSGD
jgi:hypothetical protein